MLERLRRIVTREPQNDSDDAASHHIRLVVGLGNPGKEHADNRHNVGFWTINRLARRNGIDLSSAGQASLGEGRIGDSSVALAKPRTYVNRSGTVVWNLIKRLELDDAQQLLVVYDDIDLPLGKIRLRAKGGSGGYRGLQSIIDATGSDEFARLRIGIGRPQVDGEPSWDPDVVADYVLANPTPDEREALDAAVERAIEAIKVALANGVEAAMQRVN